MLNQRGLDRALASAGVHEVNYVLVATDEFSQRNQGISSGLSLGQWAGVATAARAAGLRTTLTVAAAFGCPFTGEVPVERVRALVEQAGLPGLVVDEAGALQRIGDFAQYERPLTP